MDDIYNYEQLIALEEKKIAALTKRLETYTESIYLKQQIKKHKNAIKRKQYKINKIKQANEYKEQYIHE